MLVISRDLQDAIAIGAHIRVTVLSIHSRRVRLGIDAPEGYRVTRVDANPIFTHQSSRRPRPRHTPNPNTGRGRENYAGAEVEP